VDTFFIVLLVLVFGISVFISLSKRKITWSCAIAPLVFSFVYAQNLSGGVNGFFDLTFLLAAFIAGAIALLGCSVGILASSLGAMIKKNSARRGKTNEDDPFGAKEISQRGVTTVANQSPSVSARPTSPPVVSKGPWGICPNCDSKIPLDSIECPNSKCKALFGPNSAWQVKPLYSGIAK
jgi:hypothetical protein